MLHSIKPFLLLLNPNLWTKVLIAFPASPASAQGPGAGEDNPSFSNTYDYTSLPGWEELPEQGGWEEVKRGKRI